MPSGRSKPPRAGSRDDDLLWQQVADSVTPLPATVERQREAERKAEIAAARAARQATAPTPTKTEQTGPKRPRVTPGGRRLNRLQDLAGAEDTVSRSPDVRPGPGPAPRPLHVDPDSMAAGPLRRRVAGLDARTAEKLRRGRFPIDARLDLHGMNRDQAHSALRGFVLTGHSTGMRCLLVITGKGSRRERDRDTDGPLPMGVEKPGRLRRELPHWLKSPDLAPLVLAAAPAIPAHGGSGACYILLRRRRDAR